MSDLAADVVLLSKGACFQDSFQTSIALLTHLSMQVTAGSYKVR